MAQRAYKSLSSQGLQQPCKCTDVGKIKVNCIVSHMNRNTQTSVTLKKSKLILIMVNTVIIDDGCWIEASQGAQSECRKANRTWQRSTGVTSTKVSSSCGCSQAVG